MHPNTPSRGRRSGAQAPTHFTLALSLTCAALALPAQAQQANPADPSDPQAKIPALSYVGSLARYRALQDPPASKWQEVNERANRAGGWRTYAREKLAADDPPAPSAPTASSTSKPAPAKKGHEGHASR